MRLFLLLSAAGLIGLATAFGGGEDRFVRKYAMMKVYESCFGADVVRQVRQEMRAACAKCSERSQQQQPAPPPPAPAPSRPQLRPAPAPAAVRPQLQAEALEAAAAAMDAAKFQHAILALSKRVSQQTPQQQYPFAGYTGGYYPSSQGPIWSPQAGYSPPPNYLAYYQPPGPPFTPYQQGYYPPGINNDLYPQGRAIGQRKSRDLDLRGQLETLTSRISGKVKNVTCVMQELGYLDDNLQPHYPNIIEKINELPIGDELKKDMADGVEYCKQFSQCVPETKKNKFPLSKELAQPMFFFRCYKHKKLEACVMKDIRERYSHNEDMSDVDSMTGGELRSLSSEEDTDRDDYEDMALAMYEFMYGGDGADFYSMA